MDIAARLAGGFAREGATADEPIPEDKVSPAAKPDKALRAFRRLSRHVPDEAIRMAIDEEPYLADVFIERLRS